MSDKTVNINWGKSAAVFVWLMLLGATCGASVGLGAWAYSAISAACVVGGR